MTIGSALWAVGGIANRAYKLYRASSKAAEDENLYVIKISESDDIFYVVEEWLMDAIPDEAQKSVYAHSEVIRPNDQDVVERQRKGRSVSEARREAVLDEAYGMSLGQSDDRVEVNYSFDGTIAAVLEIAGHVAEVFTVVPERVAAYSGGGDSNVSLGVGSKTINIVCKSAEARIAILEEIESQSQYLVQTQPRMFISSKWGDWRKRPNLARRSRDSVILKEGQMDRILGYLTGFLSNREAYEKADIPFRTGMLLHGEPGSGKSSTALAIANELKMNVFVVSLTSLTSDDALSDCFAGIPANSIVVLEDIDIVSAVRDRNDDDNEGVTMTGMLNVLDGFQSPPGVITIMTTNRLDVLDPAIIRPGRVDLMENLDCLDSYQLRGMCQYFMGTIPDGLPTIVPADGISSAEIMGVMRKHIPDFSEAGPDIVKFIDEKLVKSMDTEVAQS